MFLKWVFDGHRGCIYLFKSSKEHHFWKIDQKRQ